MALELALISVMAGIVLGLRYKVLILVPAIILAMGFAMIVGVARADRFGSVVLSMAVLAAAVQFGYLIGIAIRAVVGSVILKQPNGASHNKPAGLLAKEKSEFDETPNDGSDGSQRQ
jgi:hypothetical protein